MPSQFMRPIPYKICKQLFYSYFKISHLYLHILSYWVTAPTMSELFSELGLAGITFEVVHREPGRDRTSLNFCITQECNFHNLSSVQLNPHNLWQFICYYGKYGHKYRYQIKNGLILNFAEHLPEKQEMSYGSCYKLLPLNKCQ